MTILEKMARAMNHLTACSCEEDETCEECREAARAARDAMIEGLTDDQLFTIYKVTKGVQEPTSFCLGGIRAALIEATEVDDG